MPQPTPNPRREMRPESGPNRSMDSNQESSTYPEVLETVKYLAEDLEQKG